MSLNISVQSDLSRTVLALQVRSQGLIDAAAVRALNRAATTVRAEAGRRIRERYNLRVSVIKDDLRLVRARRGSLESQVIARGAPIPLIEFGARQSRRAGLTVQVRRDRGRKRVRNAFIATMKSGHRGAYARRGRERLPIDELYSIGVPSMFSQREILRALRGVATQRFATELARELKFRSGRANG